MSEGERGREIERKEDKEGWRKIHTHMILPVASVLLGGAAGDAREKCLRGHQGIEGGRGGRLERWVGRWLVVWGDGVGRAKAGVGMHGWVEQGVDGSGERRERFGSV